MQMTINFAPLWLTILPGHASLALAIPTSRNNGTPIGFPDGIDLSQEQVTINGITLPSARYDVALHEPYNGDHPDLGANSVATIDENAAYIASRGQRPTIKLHAPAHGWFRLTWRSNSHRVDR